MSYVGGDFSLNKLHILGWSWPYYFQCSTTKDIVEFNNQILGFKSRRIEMLECVSTIMEKNIRDTTLFLVDQLLFKFLQLIVYLNTESISRCFKLCQCRSMMNLRSMSFESKMCKYLIIIWSWMPHKFKTFWFDSLEYISNFYFFNNLWFHSK